MARRRKPSTRPEVAMGRGARRGFARGMRAARQKIRGLGGETSAPSRSKRGKGIKSFAAILRRTRS